MIELSQTQEKRARKLHFSNFIIDYSPFGEPFIMTSRHREQMIKVLKKHKPPSEVRYIMAKDRLRELARIRKLSAKQEKYGKTQALMPSWLR